jgi:hypothetical protein
MKYSKMSQNPLKTFSQRTRTQLVQYKRAILDVAEDGLWKGKSYPHILPCHLKALNIVASIRECFWSELPGMDIQLHRYFHHLNSSQALAFNLFYPAITELDSGMLLKRFSIDGDREEFCFEKVFDDKQPDEPEKEGTNFDCYIRLRSGAQVFFEVKYSEQGFGGCLDDERHRRKLEQIYRKRLLRCVGEDCLEPEFFFKHYQLLRNISYLSKPEDRLFLIFPMANEKLAYAAGWLDKHLTPETRKQVEIVYLEELVDWLVKESKHQVWEEFAEKYLVD